MRPSPSPVNSAKLNWSRKGKKGEPLPEPVSRERLLQHLADFKDEGPDYVFKGLDFVRNKLGSHFDVEITAPEALQLLEEADEKWHAQVMKTTPANLSSSSSSLNAEATEKDAASFCTPITQSLQNRNNTRGVTFVPSIEKTVAVTPQAASMQLMRVNALEKMHRDEEDYDEDDEEEEEEEEEDVGYRSPSISVWASRSETSSPPPVFVGTMSSVALKLSAVPVFGRDELNAMASADFKRPENEGAMLKIQYVRVLSKMLKNIYKGRCEIKLKRYPFIKNQFRKLARLVTEEFNNDVRVSRYQLNTDDLEEEDESKVDHNLIVLVTWDAK